MSVTDEDKQKALRISRVVQDYLGKTGQNGLRSTDIYEMLLRKNLVEKDDQQGFHFRKFLRKLRDANLLSLIPQCSYRPTSGKSVEWHFHKIETKHKSPKVISTKISTARITINALIKRFGPLVDQLPNTPYEGPFNLPEIRKKYPRSNSIWTTEEYRIMKEAYGICKKVDLVAELLHRKPSAVTSENE